MEFKLLYSAKHDTRQAKRNEIKCKMQKKKRKEKKSKKDTQQTYCN